MTVVIKLNQRTDNSTSTERQVDAAIRDYMMKRNQLAQAVHSATSLSDDSRKRINEIEHELSAALKSVIGAQPGDPRAALAKLHLLLDILYEESSPSEYLKEALDDVKSQLDGIIS